MVKLNKTNLFASLMLLSALFVSCSRGDNPIAPLSDDPVPEQPSDDQPGDDQPGDDQPGDDQPGDDWPAETAYLECPDNNHPHMIDLGLPSGTKWACCNVGATTPEDYGDYFAWGETSPKNVYDWDTYQYGYYNDDDDYSHLIDVGSDIAGTSYDAATANWGAPWRMPSLAQMKELFDNTTSVWATLNGVNGRTFTGSNGGSIFLPAAGGRQNGELLDAGWHGCYWESTLAYLPKGADDFFFGSGALTWYWSFQFRYYGYSVRPVR